MNMTKHKCV